MPVVDDFLEGRETEINKLFSGTYPKSNMPEGEKPMDAIVMESTDLNESKTEMKSGTEQPVLLEIKNVHLR